MPTYKSSFYTLPYTISIKIIKTKIIDAQQAKLRNNYKNTKLQLLKTNVAIWFNKIYKILMLAKMHGTIIKKLLPYTFAVVCSLGCTGSNCAVF
jgi:hypothetical protein